MLVNIQNFLKQVLEIKKKKINMFAIKSRKIFYGISGALVLASLILLFTLGLKPGIDFTGGSMLEVSYIENVPAQKAVEEKVVQAGFPNAVVRESGENGFFIKL